MKVLLNKLKKCNKVLLTLFIIGLVLYFGSLIFLTYNLLTLSGIETGLRIAALVIFYLFFIGYLIGGLVTLITKRKKTFILLFIITILFSGIFTVASYYIDKTYSKFENINKKYVTYTSNMIALKSTDEKDIKTIGMISNKDDIEGYTLANKIIKKENIDKDQIKQFDDYYEMLTALYAKEIDALFITNNYSVIFSSEEIFANIQDEVKVIYEYSEKMANKDNLEADEISSKNLTEPFTILLLGVDSEKDGLNANQAFNGDTLMMITFNPKTLNATMFSIPRDTYVPIACRGGAQNKINSSAASGTKCVIDTIEDLTDIDIDYYVKVNFKGVVDLVDALDGIDVDVPVKFCEQDSNRLFGSNEICLDKGEQHLDGEEALALSRHRKTLPRGDFQRVQHQQLVVEGIAQKAKTLRNVNDFYDVLDSISKNIDTNMSTKKMLSFYNVFKKMLSTTIKDKDEFITIDHTYLTGSDLTMFNPSTRMNMYTFQYNKSSLAEIVKLMKVNLELEEPEMIKNFNFSINEEYEQSVAGTSGKMTSASAIDSTKETLPSFVGQSASYVESWARARNISISINYITENDSGYDKNKSDGTVISQSVAARTLVANIRSITINVIKHSSNSVTNVTVKPDTDNNNTDQKPDDSNNETPPSTGDDNSGDSGNNSGNTQEPTVPGTNPPDSSESTNQSN